MEALVEAEEGTTLKKDIQNKIKQYMNENMKMKVQRDN